MSNCYDGCVTPTSDKCTIYTGVNIPALNISTGDSLLQVEQQLTTFLTPLLTGIGDAITLASEDVCTLITQYLTAGLVHNSHDWIKALSKGECNLQTQITGINGILTTLNADYTIGCLTGVTASTDTHDIVQAIITKLCATSNSVTALATDLYTNYVRVADLNSLIAAWFAANTGGGSQNYLKMVPYTAVEYYGPLTNFDGTGKGISANNYDKIYLCNGLNGTPDKRGRVAVGAISGVPGGPLDSAVNPTYAGNPNYAILDGGGANQVSLNSSQIPSHTHTAAGTTVVTLNDPGHSHGVGGGATGGGGTIGLDHVSAPSYPTSTSTTGITVTSNTPNNVAITVGATGNGNAHANIQPVRACYYIMYIPS